MTLSGGTTSCAPRRVETLALTDVLAAIPGDFERWALDATRDQVRLLGLYLASAADDEYAHAARSTREALIDQLDAHAERPQPRPVPAGAEGCDALFAMLTDNDFTGLVADMLNAQFAQSIVPLGTGEGRCCEAFYAESGGARHLVQIEHHVKAAQAELVSLAQQHARWLSEVEADIHWVVTSHQLNTSGRGDLGRAVAPWVAVRQCVVGAGDLNRMIVETPAVGREQLKLRAARAVQLGKVPPAADLPAFAQTAALGTARRRLAETGAVVITGPPGSGKSSLLEMLVADAALDDFHPQPACPQPGSGVLPSRAGEPSILFVDGATDLAQILPLLAHVHDGYLRVVITATAAVAAPLAEFVVEIGDYAPDDRAAVYYNHVWSAQHLHPEARAALAEPDAYRRVLDQPGFTPRMARDVVADGPEALERLPVTPPSSPSARTELLFGRMRKRAMAGL